MVLRHPSASLTLCADVELQGYPFEVDIDDGVVLADQLRGLSWEERRAEFMRKASTAVVADVRAKLRALLGIGT